MSSDRDIIYDDAFIQINADRSTSVLGELDALIRHIANISSDFVFAAQLSIWLSVHEFDWHAVLYDLDVNIRGAFKPKHSNLTHFSSNMASAVCSRTCTSIASTTSVLCIASTQNSGMQMWTDCAFVGAVWSKARSSNVLRFTTLTIRA